MLPRVSMWMLVGLLSGSAVGARAEGPAEAPAFTRPPSVRVAAGGARVEFALDRPTDVAVYVLGAKGEVVRHLAAGVLGANAPAPLTGDSLSQSVPWDSTDNLGQPGTGGPFKVRAAAGLTPRHAGYPLEEPGQTHALNGVVLGIGPAPDGGTPRTDFLRLTFRFTERLWRGGSPGVVLSADEKLAYGMTSSGNIRRYTAKGKEVPFAAVKPGEWVMGRDKDGHPVTVRELAKDDRLMGGVSYPTCQWSVTGQALPTYPSGTSGNERDFALDRRGNIYVKSRGRPLLRPTGVRLRLPERPGRHRPPPLRHRQPQPASHPHPPDLRRRSDLRGPQDPVNSGPSPTEGVRPCSAA